MTTDEINRLVAGLKTAIQPIVEGQVADALAAIKPLVRREVEHLLNHELSEIVRQALKQGVEVTVTLAPHVKTEPPYEPECPCWINHAKATPPWTCPCFCHTKR